jgi:hypothetical protein
MRWFYCNVPIDFMVKQRETVFFLLELKFTIPWLIYLSASAAALKFQLTLIHHFTLFAMSERDITILDTCRCLFK